MAQPHKGDRKQVATRLTTEEYDKLNRYVELTGTTKNDFIRQVLTERLSEIDLNAVNKDQDQLPMTA